MSQFGAQITLLALPLAAIEMLNATPFQVGVIRAIEYLPFILFGLFAGVVADRYQKKRILVVTDLVRALALVAIPVASLTQNLSIELLCITAFLIGSASCFFDVAYWSYLPSLVHRKHLVDANSKVTATQCAAEAAGPAGAGLLIQILTAPIAIAVNGLSFLLSAASLTLIHESQPHTVKHTGAPVKVSQNLTRGIRFILSEPLLRSLMMKATAWNFLFYLGMPVFLLYCAQTMRYSPLFIGVLFSAMGLGLVTGALVIQTILKKMHFGKLVNYALLGAGLAVCGLCLEFDQVFHQRISLFLFLCIFGFADALFNVANISLRQALTPHPLMGRMTSAMRFVSWGVVPIASLLGGWLGATFGFTETLLGAGICAVIFATAGSVLGPMKHVACLPRQPNEDRSTY